MGFSFKQANRDRRHWAAVVPVRLLFAWTLCYVVLLQVIVGGLAAGAMAGGAMAGTGDAGTILCLTSLHETGAPDGPGADGVPLGHGGAGGLHCILCPMAGGVPLLSSPPALPSRVSRTVAATFAGRQALVLAPLPTGEQGRPRAPPAA